MCNESYSRQEEIQNFEDRKGREAAAREAAALAATSPSLDQIDALASAAKDAEVAMRAQRYMSTEFWKAKRAAAEAFGEMCGELTPDLLLALLARVGDTAKLQREAWLDSARQTCPAFLKFGKCDTCESQALAKYPAAPPSPESGA